MVYTGVGMGVPGVCIVVQANWSGCQLVSLVDKSDTPLGDCHGIRLDAAGHEYWISTIVGIIFDKPSS